MIEFDHVYRTYGQKTALAGLTLSVRPGEIFAFLGPNGAGKTTTIKMMVGLLRPSGGTIRIRGHDVAAETQAANSLVGYVPDEPFLYDKLSGREFLQFLADMYGLSREHAKQNIEREIEYFQLGDFVDHLSETYSHGMKQRIVFAAAVLHEPAVLVLDEPMVGLDPKSMRLVKDLIKQKAAEGTTVFMSTHTLYVAEEIADRIGIVDHGKLQFLGTLADLRREQSLPESSLENLFLQLTAVNGAP
ncbi:MAG TPA: ABC transporter ATP-binding protein [Pirellulales bacterium]|jgi:ABC-2 type transport system ATP-binding protein|nr:ABC transporter ATP-binding protein [Pirellulales bacterium]